MTIINYELLAGPSTLYAISCMALFVFMIVLGGKITKLVAYSDVGTFFGMLLSVVIAFACTYTYANVIRPESATYEIRITYENTLGKPISVSEKDIIAKIQNNDIGTNTSNQNYIYSFEIDKKLYKELEKLEEKKSQRKRIRLCKLYKRLGGKHG